MSSSNELADQPMDKDCGCKGCRSCLVCEENNNKAQNQLLTGNPQVSIVV